MGRPMADGLPPTGVHKKGALGPLFRITGLLD